MKKKLLLTSILSIVMCLSIAFGATFALFTSESTVNVAVTSGKVQVVAEVHDTAKKTLYETEYTAFSGTAELNTAGGTVAVSDDGNVTLTNMLPGDAVKFNIKVFNKSNVTVKYRTSLTIDASSDSALIDALDITVDGQKIVDNASAWVTLSPVSNPDEAIMTYPVEISLDEKTEQVVNGENIGGLSCSFAVKVEAIQGNATPAGEVDDDTVMIFDLEDLVAFRDAVNAGDSYAGKTVKLMKDIDLSTVENWQPIGLRYKNDAPDNLMFSGTFDGNGKTISNLKSETNGAAGFFGAIVGSKAVVKNLTVENATVKGVECVGVIVGNAYTGSVTDCKVEGLIQIDGNYKVGGMLGGGYVSVTNCVVDVADNSYVKGTYVMADVEGDNVGGLIGFTGERNNESVSVITGSVNNIEVIGTRKVGGAIGYLHRYNSANLTVKNVTVSSNASADYVAENADKIIVGGMVGEVNAEARNINGTIEDSVVCGYIENLTKATVGGARGTTTAVDNATATNVTVKVLIADGVALVNGVYEISNANGMKWFANQVNTAGNSFSGKNVMLTEDIDLNNEEWTPIGQTGGYYATAYFQGTFDGNDKTISNLKITQTNDGGNYAVGLFGFVDAGAAKICKLTVTNADVTGHHWTAVIVGYMSGKVENCRVIDSKVTCTHANDAACGDKAGTVVGYVNVNTSITGCSATNCTVSAGRDAGQVIGASNIDSVENCSATNVTVTATDGCTGANINNDIIGRILT